MAKQPDQEDVAERDFYRDEIEAVLELEALGVRCPSTFDDGAYLHECTEGWIGAARRMRT